MLLIDERAKNDLGDVVSSRRELVKDDVLARDRASISIRGFLDVIESTGHERVIDNAPPVDARISGRGAILARLVDAARSRPSRNGNGSHAL